MSKRGPGRPKTVISPKDMAKAEEYAALNCQNGTICGLMGWEAGWLAGRKDILSKLTKKRQEYKLALRRAQHAKAVEGNDTTMQIWLGKNTLGQTDKQDHRLDVGDRLAAIMEKIGKTGLEPPGSEESEAVESP